MSCCYKCPKRFRKHSPKHSSQIKSKRGKFEDKLKFTSCIMSLSFDRIKSFVRSFPSSSSSSTADSLINLKNESLRASFKAFFFRRRTTGEKRFTAQIFLSSVLSLGMINIHPARIMNLVFSSQVCEVKRGNGENGRAIEHTNDLLHHLY